MKMTTGTRKVDSESPRGQVISIIDRLCLASISFVPEMDEVPVRATREANVTAKQRDSSRSRALQAREETR
jgi:hypothetical protein